MSLTTVSRGKLPEDWPSDIRKKGVLLHRGVLDDPSGKPIDVYCLERRIWCGEIGHTEFEDLANRIAALCCGNESKASFKMGQGHASITAGISKVELHLERDAISIRSSREFTGVPDSTWGDRMRFALVDAYAVINISAAVEVMLEKVGVQARRRDLPGLLRYKPLEGYI